MKIKIKRKTQHKPIRFPKNKILQKINRYAQHKLYRITIITYVNALLEENISQQILYRIFRSKYHCALYIDDLLRSEHGYYHQLVETAFLKDEKGNNFYLRTNERVIKKISYEESTFSIPTATT